MRVIWTPLALDRLEEIKATIARDKPMAAQRWAGQVFEKTEKLAAFPRQGRMVPEARREEIREIVHGNYRIMYRLEAEAIFILTVRHGSRRFDPHEIEP